MQSEIEEIELGLSYQQLIEDKASKLNINYLNNNHGIEVVPLELVIKVLKDIELRLEDARDNIDDGDDTGYEFVNSVYQDI